MMILRDILSFLIGCNCSEVWQRDGLLTWIIPIPKNVPKAFGMLSRLRDGVGSRLIRESNITVASIVAELHEILLFPIKWGKIRMTETVKGDKSPKGGVL
jgi:hypothetical protein